MIKVYNKEEYWDTLVGVRRKSPIYKYSGFHMGREFDLYDNVNTQDTNYWVHDRWSDRLYAMDTSDLHEEFGDTIDFSMLEVQDIIDMAWKVWVIPSEAYKQLEEVLAYFGSFEEGDNITITTDFVDMVETLEQVQKEMEQ